MGSDADHWTRFDDGKACEAVVRPPKKSRRVREPVAPSDAVRSSLAGWRRDEADSSRFFLVGTT